MTNSMEISAVSAVEPGNTKQVQPSIYWCFTWNNYPNDWESFINSANSAISAYVCGLEVGESGTPHVQGVLKFNKRRRPSELKWPKQIHWEKCKSWKDSIIYCSKDNKYISKGVIIPKPIKKPLEGKILYEWQQDIVNLIKTEADDRSIYWYWEPNGNTGKSSLVKQICLDNPDNVLVISGRSLDCKYIISEMKNKPEIILYDISRTLEDRVNYTVIEEIKNGCFTSTKYESKMVIMNSPHVICFANFVPEFERLSMDRWKVFRI